MNETVLVEVNVHVALWCLRHLAMPLLHDAEVPAVYLQAARSREVETRRRRREATLVHTVGHQRVRNRVDWSDRRDVVCRSWCA